MSKEKYIESIIKSKRNINIFKNMRDEDIRKVIKDIKFIQYKEKETIIKKGDKDNDIYFLMEGRCNAVIDKSVVGIINKNQTFGEFSPLTNSPRKADIIASKPSKVIAFSLCLEATEEELGGFGILYKNFSKELIKKIEMSNLANLNF